MLLHFFLRFRSFYGQNISLVLHEISETHPMVEHVVDLHYMNEECWHADVSYERKYEGSRLCYNYLLNDNGHVIRDQWQDRQIDDIHNEATLYDDWQQSPVENSVFNSRAFTKVLNGKTKAVKEKKSANANCFFFVHARHLSFGKQVCLIGSSASLGGWDVQKPVLMTLHDDVWKVSCNVGNETSPVEYKFAVYDTFRKKVISFEEAPNRVLDPGRVKNSPVYVHAFADFGKHSWRGAGVNVQLSALKTTNSWGVGDFSDLEKLTDWSVAAGLKMVQLLPINDTTSTYTRADSYPYSAISAFALHPIFLDVSKVAAICKVALPKNLTDAAKELNVLQALDYESVFRLKNEAARIIFNQAQNDFRKEKKYSEFFDENRHWLVAYAAFCYLRDKYQSADFSNWGEHAVYKEEAVADLVDSSSEHFSEIAFHYFIQYHLHNQLSDAVNYAHERGVIMKGDLPIGVGRHSMDTWMNPSLFHLDMQAGAPPDAFTKKGQNWSFPTYNWDAMKSDNYNWWRLRLTHMSHYFDATRIDHVLGFFRIWSVPMHAVEGIFGFFVPALPLYKNDFEKAGVTFDEARYCDPYIDDELFVAMFGDKSEWVRENFFNGLQFKPELNTQRKIEAYAAARNLDPVIKQKLFDLLAEVLLLRDPKDSNAFHFRIDIQDTSSFKKLSQEQRDRLYGLYISYFYERQNGLWYDVAQQKLDAIQQSSDMMICAEDLGMVPEMVEGVLKTREMLALQVQRMPKKSSHQFAEPSEAPYLSVVTPSTHDMSTIRQWWEEDRQVTQRFYNDSLKLSGSAPRYCEPEICKAIILQHLNSPAMWSVFLLQDLLSIDGGIRRMNPAEERINNPADPNHYWNYRMHVTLESLLERNQFNTAIRQMISDTQRC